MGPAGRQPHASGCKKISAHLKLTTSTTLCTQDLDSTRRMRNLVHQDVELNQKTLENLNTQGGKICALGLL